MIWTGWICYGTDADERYLRRLGVKLGPPKEGGERDCEMSNEAFSKVEPQWGRFYWQLNDESEGNGDHV